MRVSLQRALPFGNVRTKSALERRKFPALELQVPVSGTDRGVISVALRARKRT